MDDILNKPFAEITEDPFFRADNFENQPWYDDFQMYLHIGVCQPKPEHALQVQNETGYDGMDVITLYDRQAAKTAPEKKPKDMER